jgi:hypothetical protein
MNQTEILEIVSEKIEIFKKSQNKKQLPEYTEVYKDSVDFFERISVHAEIGKFPEKIFKTRAPNQNQEEFDYMKNNYKTTTFPVWSRFLGVLNRIWNDANWSIKYPEGSEDGQEYLSKNYPIYGSIEQYFKSVVTSTKEKDSNAVLCHKPYKLPVTLDKDGDLIVDETQLIAPIATIYNSAQVVGFEDGEYALIELQEKSLVEFGNTKEKTGKVFEFYDTENIWRVVQVGRKLEYKFDLILFWPHKLGYLPVRKLKGVPIQKENEVLYQSHFMSAIEPMDLILLDSSYLQASKAGHAFPHKWEYADECDYYGEYGRCVNGKVTREGDEVDCPSCKGSGRKSRASVLGVTQIKVPNNSNNEASNMSIPPLGWVAPDPTILEFLRSEISKNGEQALSILNLNTSNSDVKGGETALGKQIDREELFSFIKGISDELFDLYEFSHKCLLQMRYGEIELPEISYPKTFSIRSENDLTIEIAAANANGMPDIGKRKLVEEYMYTRFNDEETEKIIKITVASDRLAFLNSLEIQAQKLSGSVANWEIILHTSMYNFIVNALSVDPNFYEKSIEEQKIVLIDMAKAKEIEITPKKINADSILAEVNG